MRCFFIVVLTVTSACNFVSNNKTKLPFDEKVIIANFSNTTILNRGNEHYLYKHYTLSDNEESIVFRRDSINNDLFYLYSVNYAQKNNNNDSFYDDNIHIDTAKKVNEFIYLNSIMIKYGIKHVSCEKMDMGISIEIYFEDSKMIYIRNIVDVTNLEWLKYLNGITKINDHWYVDNSIQNGAWP